MSVIAEDCLLPPILSDNHQLYPWRVISKGLNIEGPCINADCLAYNQMVIINIGFGEYDLSRLILQRQNRCSMCDQKIHPVQYALNQCQWWYVDHYSTCTYALHTVNDTYELNEMKCEYRIMEIMPLSTIYCRPISSPELTCPICLNTVGNDHEIIYLRCSHSFHRDCINEWLKSNRSMANTCPICREYIAERY
ncbi:hypothetical protein I4U23_003030 [Adineta vaga]|nr:hypothetical protein I4U23_003030 [Adineta vaga]